MWFIYNTKENKYYNTKGELVETQDEAQQFYTKADALELINCSETLSAQDEDFNLNLIKGFACRGCNKFEGSQMRYDAYGIETGYWTEGCYNSSKYPYRKDRYDYEANGERLEPLD
jgi:hypothetical protein